MAQFLWGFHLGWKLHFINKLWKIVSLTKVTARVYDSMANVKVSLVKRKAWMKLRKALNKPHDSCFHCSICPFTWSDMLSSSLHFVIIQCISGIICPKSYHTYAFLRIGSTSMPYTCRFQCIRKVASKIRMEGLGVVMMTSLFLNYFAKILGDAI